MDNVIIVIVILIYHRHMAVDLIYIYIFIYIYIVTVPNFILLIIRKTYWGLVANKSSNEFW
jgi:hypothetical protein